MNDEIQKGIDESIRKALQFSARKYGDTPTDSLQLANKKYVDDSLSGLSVTYSGHINSGGTTGTLPTGWTVAHNGTGDYTVTHNLGVANIPVVCLGNTVAFICIVAYDTNTFQVVTYNAVTFAGADREWNFVLNI
jgi:hypothetical protein